MSGSDLSAGPDGGGVQAVPNVGPNGKSLEQFWDEMDGPIARQVTAVVIGCGQRGQNYANFALDFPSRLKIVAVAEPLDHRRAKMQRLHGLEEKMAVDDWPKLAEREKLADMAIIATQDQFHKDPAIAFAKKGYHLLLEKPMSTDEKECEEIAQVCEENNTIAAVCHVLRYFPPCSKIREIIDSGKIGQVVNINHIENVGFWHFAHSFVRGNWRNVETSTFSLLAKCCHDIDLLMYWMGDQKCKKIQSFGNLYHFRPSQRPKAASDRCFGCPAEKDCPYSAQKIYLEANRGYPHWPMSVVCDIEDHPKGYRAALTDALQTGPYGRCVYSCDNDVCDHQMVNMEFESGATASMTMNAFSKNIDRETSIYGTLGQLSWDGSSSGPIRVYDFATKTETEVFPDSVAPEGARTSGHRGSDFFIVNAVTKAVATGDGSFVKTDIKDSLRSHKLVFAAERSRLQGSIEHVQV